MTRFFVILVLSMGLVSCAAGIARNPVPKEVVRLADVPGFKGIRIWGDEPPANLQKIVATKIAQTKKWRPRLLQSKYSRLDYLAISGGGSEGAFGAGLLVGWSKSGRRPKFDIVTGVSTGALAAPFVFLGPQYDEQLREVYTSHSTKQLLSVQLVAGLLGNAGGITDNSGLKDLIAKYVDAHVMEAIAREHLKGRRLLIGTTNLDAQRPVIWDLGAIALQGGKKGLRLMQAVLLASAAVPGVFPPVLIEVNVNGARHREMHVDGGPTAEVFFLPARVSLLKTDRHFNGRPKRRLFVIRNGKLGPEWQSVNLSTVDIAQRALLTLTKHQGKGDLARLYREAKLNGVEYNLVAMPEDFNLASKEAFDREYMTALFDVGYQIGASGINWRKGPPD